MFKSVEELKEFIVWAKTQKIAVFKVQDVEIHVSAMAYVDDIHGSQKSEASTQSNEITEIPEVSNEDAEDLELALHSGS